MVSEALLALLNGAASISKHSKSKKPKDPPSFDPSSGGALSVSAKLQPELRPPLGLIVGRGLHSEEGVAILKPVLQEAPNIGETGVHGFRRSGVPD